MKPLLVSTYDSYGGAARAAMRLHQGLQVANVSSRILVQDRRTDDPAILGPATPLALLAAKLRPRLDAVLSSWYHRRRQGLFSPAIVPSGLIRTLNGLAPDLVHLHWVNEGFLRIETLASCRCPVVWTLHDMWPFTGGCHHSGSCDRYLTRCGTCPQLGSSSNNDLSHWTWRRKSRAWRELQLEIVSPSNWLAGCARTSSLFGHFPIEVIPNGIDTVRFAPHDKKLCRAMLGLPQDCVILLAGGIALMKDRSKGMCQLMAALKQTAPGVEVAILGLSGQEQSLELGIPVHFLGHLHDDVSLAIAYSAADIFVSPSLEENLSNMVMEAASCGVPTVAFRIGGMPDLVNSGISGILVSPGSVEELAEAINSLAGDSSLRVTFGLEARLKVEREFAIEKIVQRYIQVYERICK